MSEEQSYRVKNIEKEDELNDNSSSPGAGILAVMATPAVTAPLQPSQQQPQIHRPPPFKRSHTVSKIDFCCLSENMIRCVCANILAHIQTSESLSYVPSAEYNIWNQENGSLVCLPPSLLSSLPH
jgi:hypothetical protein